MKRVFCYFVCSLAVCSISFGQAQPPTNSAPNKPTQHKAAVTSPPPVQQGPTAGKVATGHYYTPQGHYYSPTTEGGGYYYSPTASGGGHYYTPEDHYISGSGTNYTPQGHYISGNGNYSAPSTNDYTPATGGYYSPQGQYTSGNGDYYTPTNATYTSPQGHIVSPSGSYYTPSNIVYTPSPSHYTSASSSYYTPPNVVYSPRQSQNVTPQSQATPQPAASSSMNTASAGDAADSLKTVTQSGQVSPWITFEGGLTTPGGALAETYNKSGATTVSATVGEGPWTFSGSHSTDGNSSLCWSPGFDLPGTANLNLNACAGTDGASFGASGGVGPLTGSISMPSQDVLNAYMGIIYGTGNWLGTGLYNAAPGYFNGNH